ncbi:cell division protein SepF [Candidatus Bathyarchaeota archaeon]|nr:MAG: cell division protein SepF [Candidatus Bathyarchaeota archaeon]
MELERLTGVEESLRKVIDRILGGKKPAPASPPEMYLKAIPLRTYEDVDIIKSEVRAGNIVITNVSPLAKRSIEDVKRAISELSEYMTLLEGDIARLGEERVVLTPKNVKIWRGEAKKEG